MPPKIAGEKDEKRSIKPVDLNSDFNASAARLTELQAGRQLQDIPITDEYWKALRKHRTAHNKEQ